MQTNNKLREALELIVNERGILDFCHNNLGSKTLDDWDKVYKIIRRWIDKAMSALAAPPRNCEVGTAEEQDERFRDFCAKYIGGTCTGCKLQDCGLADCALAWAHMPYEEGGES